MAWTTIDTVEPICAPCAPATVAAPSAAVEALETARRLADAGRRSLLVLRFALVNLAGFALVAAAWAQGWIGTIVAADASGLCLTIAAVFGAGLVLCARKVWLVSRELDMVTAGAPEPGSWAADYLDEVAGRSAGSRAITAGSVRMRLASKIAVVRHFANSLVLLGLIGTVLGFVIALSGVDPQRAGDVHAIGPMVSELIRGMSVALYTTLVGAALNLWLSVNYHLLHGGAVRLSAKLIALGEANARQRPVR